MSFRALGKIRDAHGIKGEMFLISYSKSFDWMPELKEAVLTRKELDENGKMVEVNHTFKIKKNKAHKVGQIVKLEGINTRNDAEAFKGAQWQVPESILQKGDEQEFYLLKLEGFEVVDAEMGVIGKIIAFSNNNAQDILEVQNGDKTFQVPYVEEFLVNVDFEAKKVSMKLPPGLLEV